MGTARESARPGEAEAKKAGLRPGHQRALGHQFPGGHPAHTSASPSIPDCWIPAACLLRPSTWLLCPGHHSCAKTMLLLSSEGSGPNAQLHALPVHSLCLPPTHTDPLMHPEQPVRRWTPGATSSHPQPRPLSPGPGSSTNLPLLPPSSGRPVTGTPPPSLPAGVSEGCGPERGRSPIPNSPSARKLRDPRNGEHMVSGAGAGRGQGGPSVPARQRAGGPDPEPDAMEKETTA